MSLLTIVQGACGEMGLVSPASVVGSSDRQVNQLFGLTNRAGRMIRDAYAWQALLEEFTFETVAQSVQTGAIPADFGRWVPNSFFNRTTRRPVTGPITPREWQWIQAQPVFSTVYLMFRERQGQLLMAPNPPAAQLIAGEYVSKAWVTPAAGGSATDGFVADGDTALLDEDLITLGLMWRFKRAKGLDYAEEMDDYERELEVKMARDGGSTMLTLAPQPVDPNRVNIPDGNFGGA